MVHMENPPTTAISIGKSTQKLLVTGKIVCINVEVVLSWLSSVTYACLVIGMTKSSI